RSNRCAMPRARRSGPLPYMGAVWRASSALWRWPAPATERQAHPACTRSTALNLPPEKYSLEVRRRVAIEAAKSSFDEGVKTLEVYTGAHLPKRQFEELAIRAAQDFEAFYAQRQAGAGTGPHTGSILVLTVDGKGVAMLPEDLREPTQRLRRHAPKPSRRGWGAGAGCMPNGWPP